MSDQKLSLKDGRQLSFAEYGDLEGQPVLFFHGTPGSRYQGLLFDEQARNNGLRLIVVERPGYGNSEPQPNRTLVDWAEDIRELLDQLRLEKVAVIGVSGGGPYALASAAQLGDQVQRAVIVSGMGQLDSDEAMTFISEEERMLIQAAQLAPEQLAAQIAQIHEKPESLVSGATAHLPEFDKTLITPENIGSYLKSLKESTKSAEGMISDYKIFAQPWGFQPEDLTIPVTFFHGTEDTTVSVYHSEKLVDKIEQAELRVLKGAGHLGGSIEGSRQALSLLGI